MHKVPSSDSKLMRFRVDALEAEETSLHSQRRGHFVTEHDHLPLVCRPHHAGGSSFSFEVLPVTGVWAWEQRENVKALPEEGDVLANTIEFDFLGKDSVQYLKQVVVHPRVYQLIQKWVPRNDDGKGAQLPLRRLPCPPCVPLSLRIRPFISNDIEQ